MSKHRNTKLVAILLATAMTLPIFGSLSTPIVQAKSRIDAKHFTEMETIAQGTEETSDPSIIGTVANETTSQVETENTNSNGSSDHSNETVESSSETSGTSETNTNETTPTEITTEPTASENPTTEPSTAVEEPVERIPLQAQNVQLYFETQALQPAYMNAIFVNGVFFTYIDRAQPLTLDIPLELLQEGVNRITFICGSSATKTYYDETVAPETRNHNDPKVKNIQATVDGSIYEPTSVVKYFITDQTIPAAISHTTTEETYQKDQAYTFGDGGPKGTPHPASLTIPYKVDFAFDFSASGEQAPTEDPNRIIKQVNAHVGAEASTSQNLAWVTVKNTETKVVVKNPSGTTVYENTVSGTSNGTVYTYTAELMGLTPSTTYTYTLSNDANRVEGSFTTTSESAGTIRFGYIADPQVSNATNAKAAGAVFNQLIGVNQRTPLDFLYIAGDHTDRSSNEDQWQEFFHQGGMFPNAAQNFMLKNTILSTQGNHDVADFKGHINVPDELGQGEFLSGVYSVDFGPVRFIVLNNASYNTSNLAENANFQLMLRFLREEVTDAKAKGMWTIVGLHKALYTGASHIDDGDMVAYRIAMNPVLTELDVDMVLAGHDHVYSRGFVDADGNNASVINQTLTEKTGLLTYGHSPNAPFHMVAEHSGGLKWYAAVNYTSPEADPVAPNYEFLDKNSATESPSSAEKKEQTYVVVEVTGDQATFVTYKMKYDPQTDTFTTQPYIYDSFVITKTQTPPEDQEPGNEEPENPEEPGTPDTVTLTFTATALQPAYNNGLFVNGVFVQSIPSNNENSIELPRSLFTQGVNTIGFMPGSNQTGTYYNVNETPETRNHNDPKVKNLVLTQGEQAYTPSSVTSYFIVDQKTPAAVANTKTSSDYDAEYNYTFGDGQPGGIPHPASTSIPYLLEFTIDLTPVASGDASWDLKDGQAFAGETVVRATVGHTTDIAVLRIGETTIPSTGSGSALFNYSSSGIQANDGNAFKNGLLINGQLAENLNEAKPSLAIADSFLRYGEENVVSLVIGTSSGVYNETLTPGAVNHDDFNVWDFSITLPNGTVVLPKLARTYQAYDINTPAATKSIVNEELYSASRRYNMGDGFPAGSNLDLYYKVDLVFQLPAHDPLTRYFTLDTQAFADGTQTIQLVVNDAVELEATVLFDNTAPVISSNLGEQPVADHTALELTVVDQLSEVTSVDAQLNGIVIDLPYSLQSELLGTGIHFLTVTATDALGNQSTERFSFTMEAVSDLLAKAAGSQDGDNYKFEVETDPSMAGPLTVDFFKANTLSAKVYSGEADELLNTDQAKEAAKDAAGFFGQTSVNGIPYQLYQVNTEGTSGDLNVTVTAKANTGETVALMVYNPLTGTWLELMAKRTFGAPVILSGVVDVETYDLAGEIRFAVIQKLADNRSDVFAWITDTQYYTQRQPLIDAKIYEQMTTYLRDEYLAGRIAYVAHTGDIIENVDNEAQFTRAAAAHDILDLTGVPNGVTTGNHDVGDYSTNMRYNKYNVYFGADRYDGQFWYGGEFGNNTHHYDLVTVGGHDLLVLYLGMGLEATPETIAWANHALAQYPNRTAIIATHQYLSPSARWITYSRAEEIYNKIIVPNANVAMVISGHDPGAARNVREMPDGRKLVEILHDYQHQPNGGDGFLRLMTFSDTGLTNVSYSPVVDRYNSFSAQQEEFSMDLAFVQNHREVSSKDFVATIKGVGTPADSEISRAETAVDSAKPFASVQVEAGETALTSLPVSEIDFSEWFATITDVDGNVYQSEVQAISLVSTEDPEATTTETQPTSTPTNGGVPTEPSETTATTEPSETTSTTSTAEPSETTASSATAETTTSSEPTISSETTDSTSEQEPTTSPIQTTHEESTSTETSQAPQASGSTSGTKPNDTKVPGTGESILPVVLALLLILAGTGALVARRKKERDQD